MARLEDVIIFVEVRTRTSSRFARPEESINPRKQSHMLAGAEDYTQLNAVDTGKSMLSQSKASQANNP